MAFTNAVIFTVIICTVNPVFSGKLVDFAKFNEDERQVMPLTGGVVITQGGIGSNIRVSCPPGYTLYNCGAGNIQQNIPDAFRFAYPINNSTCWCRDNGGVGCVAYCRPVNPAGYEIVSANFTGNGSAACPAGKKVMSCNIKPTGNAAEPFRKFYPAAGGQSCLCSDSTGATCSATCVNARPNYEIIERAGKGIITISCPTGKVLLGCGAQFTSGTPPDQYPGFFVNLYAQCQCKSNSGVTCYAMCGN